MYARFLGRTITSIFCQLLNLYRDTLNVQNIIRHWQSFGKNKILFFLGAGDKMRVRKAKILNHRVPVLS